MMNRDPLSWAPVRALERTVMLIAVAVAALALVGFVGTGAHSLFGTINHALAIVAQ
jgi:hypothetical protein